MPFSNGSRPPLPIRAFNRGGAMLRRAGIFQQSLAPEKLIEKAQRHCRWSDFGPGDFREALTRLIDSCEREARLNTIGRMALASDVTRVLCNRLAIERDRAQNSAIPAQQIRQPLFVVGLPRSGTTILHMLLACDPQHRVPLSWEVIEPSPATPDRQRERISRADRNFATLRWMAPAFCRAHPMGAELPQECVSLMSPSFLSDQYDTMFYVPTYRSWFLQQDLAPAYQWHRRVLQHLQFRQPQGRWVLKAPAHLFALPTLLSTYPDAIFVQTHRAPLQSIASVASLITMLRRIFSDVVDPLQIGRDALVYWSETMRNFLRERERLLGTGAILDLRYDEIGCDPVGAVRRVYAHFGWELTPAVEQRMRAMLLKHSASANGHRYAPAQFGLDAAECSDRFRDYTQRFGLSGATEAELAAVSTR